MPFGTVTMARAVPSSAASAASLCDTAPTVVTRRAMPRSTARNAVLRAREPAIVNE